MRAPDLGELETLDAAQVRELLDQSTEEGPLFHRLYTVFLSEGSELVADLRQRLPGGSHEAIHELVHKIKGSAAAMGARRVHALAAFAVLVCREEGDLDQLLHCPERFEEEYRRYERKACATYDPVSGISAINGWREA